MKRLPTRPNPHSFPARTGRTGLTLYEVMLALAILLPSLAVLGHAITAGSRAAVQARLETQAVMHADSLMAEVATGARPLQPLSDSPIDENLPGWTWNLDVAPGPHSDLLDVQVDVMHRDNQGQVNASYTLNRYLRDPQLFMEVALTE